MGIADELPHVPLYDPISGGGPIGSRPSRDEILKAWLVADIAPTYIEEIWRTSRSVPETVTLGRRPIPRQLVAIEGRGSGLGEGKDILGTWHWLDFDDQLFHTVAPKYRDIGGNRCIPCSLMVSNYQGRTFDFTQNPDLLRRRLERCYEYGLLPMISLHCRGGAVGEGAASVDILRNLFPKIADLVDAAFLDWELVVDGSQAAYEPQDIEHTLDIVREHRPQCVIGVEFATPYGHEPICYDGRAVPKGEEANWYWNKGPGQRMDVLMLEIAYDRADDPAQHVDDVAGATCRFQGTWQNKPNDPDNWRGPDYGCHKTVMQFEYAAYLRWSTARKKERRELTQRHVPPLRAWGEG